MERRSRWGRIERTDRALKEDEENSRDFHSIRVVGSESAVECVHGSQREGNQISLLFLYPSFSLSLPHYFFFTHSGFSSAKQTGEGKPKSECILAATTRRGKGESEWEGEKERGREKRSKIEGRRGRVRFEKEGWRSVPSIEDWMETRIVNRWEEEVHPSPSWYTYTWSW